MFKPGDKVKSDQRTPHFDAGKHWRAKLGFIIMSTDLAAESDFYDLVPGGVGVHVTRLKTEDITNNETLAQHIDNMAEAAARLQPDVKPDVISYHCTSGSIINGEKRVMDEILKGAPYTKPMTLITAIVDVLHELSIKKLVVGTPYIDEINTVEAEFLTSKGFDVLDIQGLNLKTGIDFGQLTPKYIKDFALEIDHDDADALFLSCSGIRAIEVIQEVEDAIGKPVITSNQAQMWSCLRRAGIQDNIEGYGQIFLRSGSISPIDRN
jgi:maleate isomerase